MIHNPAFAACIVVGRPEPTPRMLLAVLAKPGAQRPIGIFRRGRGRLVALGGTGLPGHSTGIETNRQRMTRCQIDDGSTTGV